MEQYRVSKAWINEHCTARGAWTCNQIQALGLKWPPHRGWKDRVHGNMITNEARAAFEFDSGRVLPRDESSEAQAKRARKSRRKKRPDTRCRANVAMLDVLCDVWRDIASDPAPAKKMATLQRYAEVAIPFEPGYSMERHRADYNAYFRGIRPGTRCFACNGMAVEQHHIILLKHGGTNDDRNRIPICRKCHEHIHGWMEPSATIKALDDAMELEDQHWRELTRA